MMRHQQSILFQKLYFRWCDGMQEASGCGAVEHSTYFRKAMVWGEMLNPFPIAWIWEIKCMQFLNIAIPSPCWLINSLIIPLSF